MQDCGKPPLQSPEHPLARAIGRLSESSRPADGARSPGLGVTRGSVVRSEQALQGNEFKKAANLAAGDRPRRLSHAEIERLTACRGEGAIAAGSSRGMWTVPCAVGVSHEKLRVPPMPGRSRRPARQPVHPCNDRPRRPAGRTSRRLAPESAEATSRACPMIGSCGDNDAISGSSVATTAPVFTLRL